MEEESVKSDKRILRTILLLFCVVALVLGVAIIVTNVSNNHNNDTGNEISKDEADDENNGEADIYKPADELITQYQKEIDAESDPEKKAQLYYDRVAALMAIFYDNDDNKRVIINDLLQADKILNNAESADNVSYYAEMIGYDDLSIEYNEIWKNRAIAEGIQIENITRE